MENMRHTRVLNVLLSATVEMIFNRWIGLTDCTITARSANTKLGCLYWVQTGRDPNQKQSKMDKGQKSKIQNTDKSRVCVKTPSRFQIPDFVSSNISAPNLLKAQNRMKMHFHNIEYVKQVGWVGGRMDVWNGFLRFRIKHGRPSTAVVSLKG